MLHFTLKDFATWERFYTTNFINSLSGFKSASLIASVNKNNLPNLAIFSNIIHIGASPALIGFINRPKEAAPHTIKNIEQTGEYTINHIPKNLISNAHQTSAKYNEGESEFDKCGFKPEWIPGVKAPFVAESNLKYSLQLEEIISIKINNTFLVIGSIQQVFVTEGIQNSDGFLQIEKAGSITTLGVDAYYETTLLDRFAYAKAGNNPKKIT